MICVCIILYVFMAVDKERYPNPLERIWYKSTPQMVRLTKREDQIVKLVARGLRNSDIAEVLGNLRARGCESHVRNILIKTGLESRTQLAIWALKHRLVELEDL